MCRQTSLAHLSAHHDDLGQLRPQRWHVAIVTDVTNLGGHLHEVADQPHHIVEPHGACKRSLACGTDSDQL